MAASFEKRRLLSASEYHAFKIIESDVAAARRGYRVFAQTSLGEVLATPRDENGFRSVVNNNGFRSINSKRVDILIIDQGGWPVVAVEYQGEGHYQGTAAARDAVKKEALRKAGVRYVEVFPGDSAEQIRSRARADSSVGQPPSRPAVMSLESREREKRRLFRGACAPGGGTMARKRRYRDASPSRMVYTVHGIQ
jgi:hypothetical protein